MTLCIIELLQGRNLLQRFSLFSKSPIVEQLVFVKTLPLENMCQRPARELARDNASFDSYRDFEFAVFRMKVRRDVIPIEDRNDYSEKSANLWHGAKYRNSGLSATA